MPMSLQLSTKDTMLGVDNNATFSKHRLSNFNCTSLQGTGKQVGVILELTTRRELNSFTILSIL